MEKGELMRKTTIFCDHCGKELDLSKDYEDAEFDLWNECVTADLCACCFEELKQAVKNFCGKEQLNATE